MEKKGKIQKILQTLPESPSIWTIQHWERLQLKGLTLENRYFNCGPIASLTRGEKHVIGGWILK